MACGEAEGRTWPSLECLNCKKSEPAAGSTRHYKCTSGARDQAWEDCALSLKGTHSPSTAAFPWAESKSRHRHSHEMGERNSGHFEVGLLGSDRRKFSIAQEVHRNENRVPNRLSVWAVLPSWGEAHLFLGNTEVVRQAGQRNSEIKQVDHATSSPIVATFLSIPGGQSTSVIDFRAAVSSHNKAGLGRHVLRATHLTPISSQS